MVARAFLVAVVVGLEQWLLEHSLAVVVGLEQWWQGCRARAVVARPSLVAVVVGLEQ